MKKVMSWAPYALLVVLAGLSAGCGQKTHPVKVVVDPSFQTGAVEKIAVFPFASALTPAADPNNLAPRTFDQFFRTELDKRNDYQWVAPTSVEYAIESEGLREDAEKFIDSWRKSHQVDAEFLAKMGKRSRSTPSWSEWWSSGSRMRWTRAKARRRRAMWARR